MKKPLIHPRTEKILNQYLMRPSHALIIEGPQGIGKRHLAEWVTRELDSQLLAIKPEEGKSQITIEQIRDLYATTRTGTNVHVVIEDAHTLSRESQNAFLKLLEEPPKNVHFLLLTNSRRNILPTILSRSQLLEVHPPSSEDLLGAATSSSLNENQLNNLVLTSKGFPGTFFELLNDEAKLKQHLESVAEAKTFYASSVFERHKLCLENQYDKKWAEGLLNLLTIIIATVTHQKANSLKSAELKRFKDQVALIELTGKRILFQNGNPKIHLAKLSMLL